MNRVGATIALMASATMAVSADLECTVGATAKPSVPSGDQLETQRIGSEMGC